MTAEPHALSVLQLAHRWQCSRQHIYNLIRRGDLPALRLGTLVRIRRADMDAYEARASESAAPASKNSEPVGWPKHRPTPFEIGQRIAARRRER